MPIPTEIHVTMLADGVPRGGLVVQSELVMNRRNNYTWVHGPSSDDGSIRITEADLDSGIQISREVGLMDCASLDNFAGSTRISPLSAEAVERVIKGYELWSAHVAFPSAYLAALHSAKRTLETLTPGQLEAVVSYSAGGGEVVGSAVPPAA